MDRYDRVAYESLPVAEADPARLFAQAQLFGLRSPRRWRVLEVGCGAGGNLVPLAARNPDDRWVGFDRAERPVNDARALAARLGAPVDVLQLDLLDALDALRRPGLPERYDLIIAHGVYSWVPEPARRALLALCGALLDEHGLAYISVNCLPGWGMRGALAGMLRYVAGDGPPERQVGRARAFTSLLAQLVPESDPYGGWLRREDALIREQGDAWLFHDLLAPTNHAVWLHEMVDDASGHGLQYLGDASLETMLPDRLPQPVQAKLASLGGGQVEQEQLLDFVLARSFRRVLLCRADVALTRELHHDALSGLYARGRVLREGPGRFRSLDGDELQTDAPLLQEVLGWLADARPATVPVSRLADAVADGRREPERVRRNLLLAATRGLIELRSRPDGLVGSPTARPVADPVARMLSGDEAIPSPLGRALRLDSLSRALLPLLDGTLGADGLVEALLAQGFTLQEGDRAMTAERARGWLAVEVPNRLRSFGREGLLVG